jgi:threonine synthase
MAYADDEEIRDAIRLLASTTGIFAETAGGVTVAALRKLVDEGRLDPEAETVVFNTGEGLKTLDAVAGQVGPTYRVKPSLRAAREAGLLG